MEKKQHPCSMILPGGHHHHWNDAESIKRREYADHHEKTTVTIHDIILQFHIDVSKIANLIVNGILEVKGFTTKYCPFPEDVLEAQDAKDRIDRLIDGLKVLLVSRTDFQDTITIDSEILNLLQEPALVFFDRKQFVDVLTSDASASPANIKSNTLPQESDGGAGGDTDSQDVESSVRAIQVRVKNDGNLEFKLPRQPAKTITSDMLGLKDTHKVWKELKEIAQKDSPLFLLNDSSSSGTYEARRKMRDKINNKLVNLLRTHFNLQVPLGFKLFEKVKGKESGMFIFKFQTNNSKSESRMDALVSEVKQQFQDMSKEDLLKAIRNFEILYEAKPDNSELEKCLIAAVSVAKDRDFLSKELVEEILESARDRRYTNKHEQKATDLKEIFRPAN